MTSTIIRILYQIVLFKIATDCSPIRFAKRLFDSTTVVYIPRLNKAFCRVWQHVVCMFLDKNNIPDEYLCEKCQPRPVDKKRAKAVQRAREKEIFKTVKVDSSDEDKKPATTAALKARKSGLKKGAAATAGLKRSVAGEKKPEKKSTKRPAKRRPVKTDSSSSLKTEQGIKKPSPRKLHRRKSASATDIETEEEPPNDAMSLR